jgi:hypothetical protein
MTILERVRDGRGARIDLEALADQARNRLPDTDGIGIDTEAATDAAKDVVKDAADSARDRFDRVAELVRDVAREASKAGSDAHLDRRLDEISERVKSAVPTTTIGGVIMRLERELPDTDKDRYDRAFERGRVRTRTIYLGVGAAVGIGAGIVAAELLDPQRGKARREAIARLKDDVARRAAKGAKVASERAQDAVQQARAAAEQRGIVKPEGAGASATAKGDMVPVMAVGDRPVTDPSSTVLEPLPGLEGGGLERRPTAIDASSVADATGNRDVITSSHG